MIGRPWYHHFHTSLPLIPSYFNHLCGPHRISLSSLRSSRAMRIMRFPRTPISLHIITLYQNPNHPSTINLSVSSIYREKCCLNFSPLLFSYTHSLRLLFVRSQRIRSASHTFNPTVHIDPSTRVFIILVCTLASRNPTICLTIVKF